MASLPLGTASATYEWIPTKFFPPIRRKLSIEPLDSAYKILKSSEHGRCVVAGRDLKEGDVIALENPLVLGPTSFDLSPAYCMGCLESVGPFTKSICPGCKWQVCHELCPGLTDPLRHALECDLLRTANCQDISYNPAIHLLLRCLLLRILDPFKWKLLLEMANDLKGTVLDRHIKLNSEALFINKYFCKGDFLRDLSQGDPKVLADWSDGTIAKMATLIHGHQLVINNPTTGKMAFVTEIASFMHHNCIPNTRIYFEHPVEDSPWRTQIIIRAATDIPKGEPLTTSVTDALLPTLLRQREVKWRRGMHCVCKRCLDPTEMGTYYGSIRCKNCIQQLMPLNTLNIEKSNWQCKFCGFTARRKLVHYVMARCDELILPFSVPELVSFARVEAKLSRFEWYLWENNYYCILLRAMLAHSIGRPKKHDPTFFTDEEEVCRLYKGFDLSTSSDKKNEKKSDLAAGAEKAKRGPTRRGPTRPPFTSFSDVDYLGREPDLFKSLTDEELEVKIVSYEDVMDILQKFGVVGRSYAICFVTCAIQCVYASLEMTRRKRESKKLSPLEAITEIAKNRKNFIRAIRLLNAKYIGPEEVHKEETLEEQLVFLVKGKGSGDFQIFSLPEEFLI